MSGEDGKDSYEQYLDTMEVVLDHPIAFHRCFSQVAGSVCAGLMLSQLWYWTKIKGRGEWIYKTIEEMEEETTLSRREQETARLRLQQIKVLEVERRGLPAKLYYRVNFEKLVSLIASVQTTLADSAKLDRRDPPNKIGAFSQTINTEITSEITPETTNNKRANKIPKPWPSDLKLTLADMEFAFERGINAKAEFDAWRDDCAAHDRRYIDWKAAWRTRCRNAVRFGTANGQPAPAPIRAGLTGTPKFNEPPPTAEQRAAARRQISELVGMVSEKIGRGAGRV